MVIATGKIDPSKMRIVAEMSKIITDFDRQTLPFKVERLNLLLEAGVLRKRSMLSEMLVRRKRSIVQGGRKCRSVGNLCKSKEFGGYGNLFKSTLKVAQ